MTRHFWLNSDQQALMDSAMASATDYPYIAMINLPRSWKRKLARELGSPVEEHHLIRRYWLTRDSCNIVFYQPTRQVHSAHNTIIRLTESQAMMMKLRYSGDPLCQINHDPTGQSWGNLVVASTGRFFRDWVSTASYRRHPGSYHITRWIDHLVHGLPVGPHLESVGDWATLVPREWRAWYVWENAGFWAMANKVPEFPARGSEAINQTRELFDIEEPLLGHVLARDFIRNPRSMGLSALQANCTLGLFELSEQAFPA